jgi:hypothetical protein
MVRCRLDVDQQDLVERKRVGKKYCEMPETAANIADRCGGAPVSLKAANSV